MSTCPDCGHSLLGLPGAPTDSSQAFTADVRCPECGVTMSAGTIVLIGGSSAFAMMRARPWHERIVVSLVMGSGCLAVVLHVLAGFSAWYWTLAVLDLAAGGARYTSIQAICGLVIASVVLIGTAVFWWRRRPSVTHAGKRANELDKQVILGPAGVREGNRSFRPEQVRAIQVFECVGAGDEKVVVAVRVIAMTEFGGRSITEAVHVAIPRGTLPAFANTLMAALCGRTSPAERIGDEIEGETILLGDEIEGESILPRFNRRWILPATVVAIPVMLTLAVILGNMFGGLVGVIVGFGWLLFLPFAAEPSILTSSVRWTLSPKALSIGTVMPLAVPGTSFSLLPATMFLNAWPTERVRCLELKASHGMPYLVVRFKSRLRRARRIVPRDWLGMEPAVYAKQVADRLGVPLFDSFRR